MTYLHYPELFDVVAVNIKTNDVRIFARDKSEASAEAVINSAIRARGLDVEFYATTSPGKYNDGDKWSI